MENAPPAAPGDHGHGAEELPPHDALSQEPGRHRDRQLSHADGRLLSTEGDYDAGRTPRYRDRGPRGEGARPERGFLTGRGFRRPGPGECGLSEGRGAPPEPGNDSSAGAAGDAAGA